MDLQQARQFVESVEWVFAKSYAKSFPHEYTTRTRVGNDELFESFISYARDNAVIKSFYGNEYLYFELDGLEYWEMGRPLKAIEVLNRAIIDDEQPYRKRQPKEGARELLLSKLKQRDSYVDHLLCIERTPQQEEELQWLLNNKRKSPNRISRSSQKIKDYSI